MLRLSTGSAGWRVAEARQLASSSRPPSPPCAPGRSAWARHGSSPTGVPSRARTRRRSRGEGPPRAPEQTNGQLRAADRRAVRGPRRGGGVRHPSQAPRARGGRLPRARRDGRLSATCPQPRPSGLRRARPARPRLRRRRRATDGCPPRRRAGRPGPARHRVLQRRAAGRGPTARSAPGPAADAGTRRHPVRRRTRPRARGGHERRVRAGLARHRRLPGPCPPRGSAPPATRVGADPGHRPARRATRDEHGTGRARRLRPHHGRASAAARRRPAQRLAPPGHRPAVRRPARLRHDPLPASTPPGRARIARHQTCRVPGCRTPAHRCDLDHNVAFDAVACRGSTSSANLGPKCRPHHRLKGYPGWSVTQYTDGTIIWATPSGHTYRSTRRP